MSDLKNALKKLCLESNTVKETYYGSSHRSVFTLNGEKAEWDVFHIGIPFDPQKEAELMRRFGLNRTDLPIFYGSFENSVVRHINLTKAMNATGIPAIRRSVTDYRSVQYYPRLDREGHQIGQDFYFISRPMENFVGTDIITQDGAYLQDINNLAVRLLQTAKTLNDNGFSLGAVDLDSCFYVSDEFEKKFLKLGYFLYGSGPGITPDTFTEDVRAFIPETVAIGTEPQGLDSDVRTICAYIWTMLDGKHYTEPNQNAWIAQKFYSATPQSVPVDMLPRYAPPELSALLSEGMARGADAMRVLQTEIRQLNKRIAAGELPNVYVPFESPSYLQKPLPPLREETDRDQGQTDSEEKGDSGAEPQSEKRKKPKIAGIITAVAALLVLSGAIVYLFMRTDVFRQLFHPIRYSMSGESNLYAADGKVVNSKLQVSNDYTLDGDGNIVSSSEPDSILFPSEYVSDYIFVDNVKLTVVEKSFSSIWAGKALDKELREGVIDLRNIQDLFYSYDADAVNEIPESTIETSKIGEDSLILLSNDPEDPESFTVVMLMDMTAGADNQNDDATESREDSEEGTSGSGYPVQEVGALSDGLLYKLQGEWRNKVTVSIEPDTAVNSRVTLTSLDPDHMYFVVLDANGTESKTKSIRLSQQEEEDISFYIIGNTEGKYQIRIESDDGNLAKNVQMTFSPPNDYLIDSLPPRPTPVPVISPEDSPIPDPDPTTTPTPAPTPWQGGDNGYIGGNPGGSTTPVTEVDPVETIPDPTPAPVYTPEPVVPLSCSVGHVNLAVGESLRLGDYLDGIEGGYLTAIPSPAGIISIDQANGFLLTGLASGTCTIVISKGTESISVPVTVS